MNSPKTFINDRSTSNKSKLFWRDTSEKHYLLIRLFLVEDKKNIRQKKHEYVICNQHIISLITKIE